MAHPVRDVRTEMIDLTGLSPAEIDALEPSCLARTLAWIMRCETDPTDPLFGGDPPARGPWPSGGETG
jgi:hypothetical protein